MSIIQSIRDKGSWIFIAIALALVAFIVEDGLSRRGSVFGSGNTVGKVNGVRIDKKEFDKKVQDATENNRQDASQVQQQLWNEEVSKILLNEEFEAAGIECTDKELSEELFKPGSVLMNQFRDPKTGQVDVEKAKETFAEFKKSGKLENKIGVYQGIIEPTKLNAKYKKYNNLFTQAAYAPKWLVEKQQNEASNFATISYVAVPYSTIADSTIKVTDDEIMNYARKHSKQYEQDDETRTLQYVMFEALPSAADSAKTKSVLETKKIDLVAATDMEKYFAKNTTEIPYTDIYLTAASLKQQQVKDTLLKMTIGGVYGPYVQGNNYVLAKMVDVKATPDSVKVRHILVATHERDPQTGRLNPNGRDDSTAKHIMDTIRMKLNAGSGFDSICKKYSDDPSKEKGGVIEYFTTGSMVANFNNFAFTHKVGDKDVVKTEFGYHYVEILGQKGSATCYKIAYLAKPISLSNETDADVKAKIAQFIAAVKDKKSFEDEAKKINKNTASADNIKKEDYNVSYLGSNRQLVRWMYEKGEGDITPSFYSFSNNRYLAGIITAVNKKGLPSVQTLRPNLEPTVRNEKKAKQIIDKMKGATLEAMAASVGNNTQVLRFDTLPANNTFIPALGTNDPKFSGAAFNIANKGKITEPIAGQMGVFALRVENIGARASMPVDPNNLRTTLNNSIKNAGNKITNEGLKKAATIVDNRGELY